MDSAQPSPLLRRLTLAGMASVALAFLLTLYPLAAAAVQAGDETLGVLFYTPAERSTIVRARGDNPTTLEEQPPPSVQLDGLVRRGRGKSTVWLNNRPIPEGHSIGQKHALTVTTTGVAVDGKPLRIGESLDLTTGERNDFIAPGDFSIRNPK